MSRERLYSPILWPYKVALGIVKYPQMLAEHMSGWTLAAIGMVICLHSPTLSGMVFGIMMISVGACQCFTTTFWFRRWKIHGFCTALAFAVWSFLGIFTLLTGGSPVISAICPAMVGGCALAFWSMNRLPSERSREGDHPVR